MGWLSRLFSGEDAESREARRRMAIDMQDPRKTFVWGVVSISYEVDPAYLPAHASTAIREWYGVRSPDDIVRWTAADFAANAPEFVDPIRGGTNTSGGALFTLGMTFYF